MDWASIRVWVCAEPPSCSALHFTYLRNCLSTISSSRKWYAQPFQLLSASKTDKDKYIVRAVSTPRFKSKLWCFNVFGLLGAFQLLSLSHCRLTMSSAVLCYRSHQFRLPCGVLQRRRHLHYRPSIQICDATHHLRRGAEFLSHPSLCHPSTKALLLQELA